MTDRLGDETQRRTAQSRMRSIQTLERAIETLADVIRQNERLAEDPDHRAHAEERIREGKAEMARAREQIEALRSGLPPPGSPSRSA